MMIYVNYERGVIRSPLWIHVDLFENSDLLFQTYYGEETLHPETDSMNIYFSPINALLLTASCLSPLSEFESHPGM